MAKRRYGYPVTRENRQWYGDRDLYIGARSDNDDPHLCHVLETAARATFRPRSEQPWFGFPWLTMVLGSGSLAIADEPGLNSVSLSGRVQALVERDIESRTSGALTRRLKTSADFAGQAAAFTTALVRDRMLEAAAEATADAPTGDGEWDVEPLAAQLVLLASLLTNWFDQVRAATSAPLSRWDDDEAVLPVDGTVDTQMPNLFGEVLEPALELIASALADLNAGRTAARTRVAAAVARLLGVVRAGLHPPLGESPRLRIDHLRLLTEISWHFLLVRTSVYPGWTDLLLGLMLHEHSNDDEFRRARPRFRNLGSLTTAVRDLIMPPTKRSWELSRPTEDATIGPRDHLYRTVAQVLWSEADVRTDLLTRDTPPNVPAPPTPPPPTTFVTSFDIEAEMGLWTTGLERLAEGKPATFNVVLPVHLVRDPESEEAEPCWLLGEVVPRPLAEWDDHLAALQRPDRWRLLTDDDVDNHLMWQRPTVVHLSGCPLFELPDLEDAERAGRLIDQLRLVGIKDLDLYEAQLVHAVTVDEYLALRQAEAEFFFHGTGKTSAGERNGRGMPRELATNSDTNPRFWMALGVPIGDPAVRHRLVAQITLLRMFGHEKREMDSHAARASSALSGTPPAAADGPGGRTGSLLSGGRPSRSVEAVDAPVAEAVDPLPPGVRSDVDGVVINRRVNDDEASLLYWLGFDVVRGNCQSFVGDLEHYVAHLQGDERRLRTSPRGGCRLPVDPKPGAA